MQHQKALRTTTPGVLSTFERWRELISDSFSFLCAYNKILPSRFYTHNSHFYTHNIPRFLKENV